MQKLKLVLAALMALWTNRPVAAPDESQHVIVDDPVWERVPFEFNCINHDVYTSMYGYKPRRAMIYVSDSGTLVLYVNVTSDTRVVKTTRPPFSGGPSQ